MQARHDQEIIFHQPLFEFFLLPHYIIPRIIIIFVNS